jgi:hypothetical protein
MHGHFKFNVICTAMYRTMHARHPVYQFLHASMRHSYSALIQTGSLSTDEYGIAGTVYHHGEEHTEQFTDAFLSWDHRQGVRHDAAYPQNEYEARLFEIIDDTCERFVNVVYDDDAMLLQDTEMAEFWLLVTQHVSGWTVLKRTRPNLVFILQQFHRCIVIHDIFHRHLWAEGYSNPNTGPINLHHPRSISSDVYTTLLIDIVMDIIAWGPIGALPFGYMWRSAFDGLSKYHTVMKQSIIDLDNLADDCPDAGYVHHTIMH